jgi:hypothetical protein
MKVRADFNGLFGEVLCLSHEDSCKDANGNLITLQPGMFLTAFDEDSDDRGDRDDLVASGAVEPSPDWLRCKGSRWVLRIDRNGVRHESEVRAGTVYLLWHPDMRTDEKLIGVYRTEAEAVAAVERIKAKPGFSDTGGKFEISPYELNQDHWSEGFGYPVD